MRQYISIVTLVIVACVTTSVFALNVEVSFKTAAAASRSADLMTVAPNTSDTPMVGAEFVIAVRFNADFSLSVVSAANVAQVLGNGNTVVGFENDQPDAAGYSVSRVVWMPVAVGQYHIHLVPADGSGAEDKAPFQVIAAAAQKAPTIDNWTVSSAVVGQQTTVRVDYTASSSATITGVWDKTNQAAVPVMGAGTPPSTGSATYTATFSAEFHTLKFTVADQGVSATASNNFEVLAAQVAPPASPVNVTLVDNGIGVQVFPVGAYVTFTVISPGVPSSITVDWGNGTFVALDSGSTVGVVSYIVNQFTAPGTFTIKIQVVVNGQTVVLTKTVTVVAGVPLIVVRQPFPFRGKNFGDVQYMTPSGHILDPKDPNDQALFQPLGLKFAESPAPNRFSPGGRTLRVQSLVRWWYWPWYH